MPPVQLPVDENEVQTREGALAPHPELHDYYDGAKTPFVSRIFNEGAADYDRIERMMAFGSGSWYRRQALKRAGLAGGMRVLDVATGTGLVAEEAAAITGDPKCIIGVDPSPGMLAEAKQKLAIRIIRGTGEQLPFADASFDFLSMGYALRHLADLRVTFSEFHRVLKPGGKLCVLEITRPAGRFATTMLKTYMKTVVPLLTRFRSNGQASAMLWRYYWDTIESCLDPSVIISAIESAGFTNAKRYTELGIFSEYTAIRS